MLLTTIVASLQVSLVCSMKYGYHQEYQNNKRELLLGTLSIFSLFMWISMSCWLHYLDSNTNSYDNYIEGQLLSDAVLWHRFMRSLVIVL